MPQEADRSTLASPVRTHAPTRVGLAPGDRVSELIARWRRPKHSRPFFLRTRLGARRVRGQAGRVNGLVAFAPGWLFEPSATEAHSVADLRRLRRQVEVGHQLPCMFK